MTSETAPSVQPATTAGLFDNVLARGAVRSTVDDSAWLAALLEVEAALALAQAQAGVIPSAAAEAVADACRVFTVDLSVLSAEAAGSGNPVVPLVARLRTTVPEAIASYVHYGATSQDILDSAAMVLAHRALTVVMADLGGAADAAAGLADEHRSTPIAGRTLLKQALPTTFGLKAAGWMVGLDAAVSRLATVRASLPAQFGGAAGTLSPMVAAGVEVGRLLAAELGLAEATLPWHTIRTPIADLAGALGHAAGIVGKAARDVTLLAQDEVAEVQEGSPGGSSAMAHKRNPVAAVSALAGAAQAPGLVATLLASMVQEHERAAGAWHAEWRPLRELLIATGSAASWLRECLSELVVDEEAMRRNLVALQGLLGGTDLGAAPDLVDRALSRRAVREDTP